MKSRVKQICKQCGVEFFAKQYFVRHGGGLFCSRSCSGKHVRKLKPIRYWLGKKNIDLSKRIAGENHPQWKGKNVSYRELHKWVENHRGKLDTCEYCGKSGLIGKKIHWANKTGKYLRDLTDWLRLCAPCHRKYDLKNNLILAYETTRS